MPDQRQLGIEAVGVSLPPYSLDLRLLAEAKGIDPAKYTQGLGCRRMAIWGPEDDPVTLAAGAAARLLDRFDVSRDTIGTVIVGTESGVDASKPIAVYVHGLLGLPRHCRTFDAQHACYGATAGLQLATSWCASPSAGGCKALVIATDVARYEVGSAGEPTQGAGAVALLVGQEAKVLSLDAFPAAVCSNDVMDFWRPHYRSTAVVDGQYSLSCCLEALEGAWSSYRLTSGLGWDDLRYQLFHLPFPKMAQKAFRLLHEREAALRSGDSPSFEATFARRVTPGLWASDEVGNIYSGSLYLSLAALLERGDSEVEGRRVGLFSYGSGSCGEFFSGRLGSSAAAWRGRIGLAELLAAREEVGHARYLELRRESEALAHNGSFRKRAPRPGHFSFCGIEDHRRRYLPPAEGAPQASAGAPAPLGLNR
jgi:hydroxymethylglutaryl-CoA synthase